MSYTLKWNLLGTSYTTDELTERCKIPRRILAERLANGWDVLAATSIPVEPKMISDKAAAYYKNGPVDIVFVEHIPGVFAHMQPTLMKRYTARPYCAGNKKAKAKLYYIITLDNGKPLIVYPGEFEWLGSTAAAA